MPPPMTKRSYVTLVSVSSALLRISFEVVLIRPATLDIVDSAQQFAQFA